LFNRNCANIDGFDLRPVRPNLDCAAFAARKTDVARLQEGRNKIAQAILDNVADVGPKGRGPQARFNAMDGRVRPRQDGTAAALPRLRRLSTSYTGLDGFRSPLQNTAQQCSTESHKSHTIPEFL